MIRLLEIILFLAPFGVFATWRLLAPNAEIGPKQLIAGAFALAISFGLLVWLRQQDAVPREITYEPAHLQNGTITPPSGRGP